MAIFVFSLFALGLLAICVIAVVMSCAMCKEGLRIEFLGLMAVVMMLASLLVCVMGIIWELI